jgi:hypothetical protein
MTDEPMPRFDRPYERVILSLWEQFNHLGPEPWPWTPRAIEWMSRLPRSRLLLLAAHACWLDAWTAGFHSFFGLSTGIFSPEAAEGFRLLGLPLSAGIIEEANRYFGVEYPRDVNDRMRQLPQHRSAKPRNALDDLDERFLKTLEDEQVMHGDWEDLADAFVLRQGM